MALTLIEEGIVLTKLNYKELGNNTYRIKVKVVYEDGTEIEREIYQKMLRITSLYPQAEITQGTEVTIEWDGETGKEYDIRVAKQASETSRKKVIVGKGDFPEKVIGTIKKVKFEEVGTYNIAVKDTRGQYYYIIEVEVK